MQENEEHRAIYVGLTQNTGQRLFDSLPEECKARALALGVDPLVSDLSADYILAPLAALKAASECKKVLVVFDDVLLHHYKEKHVYDLAS